MKILSKEQIQTLFDKYKEILELEVNEFGCKPTEVRHLIGRMGEFFCALSTNGTLSHETNQHGFDVISNGKRISVKTTAQESGFISISKSTIELVDELMVIQYKEKDFHILYYGDIQPAIEIARTWQDKYELDISKAKSL